MWHVRAGLHNRMLTGTVELADRFKYKFTIKNSWSPPLDLESRMYIYEEKTPSLEDTTISKEREARCISTGTKGESHLLTDSAHLKSINPLFSVLTCYTGAN